MDLIIVSFWDAANLIKIPSIDTKMMMMETIEVTGETIIYGNWHNARNMASHNMPKYILDWKLLDEFDSDM